MKIEDIESAIFAQLFPDQLKVAMLVAKAFTHSNNQPTEAEINAALLRLVARDDVVTFGKVTNWTHSEMKRV